MEQTSLAAVSGFELKRKATRKSIFLAVMEQVVPWAALVALITPHAPVRSSKGGRPHFATEAMLRIHFMQQWFGLSDPAMEEALYEIESMRRFAGLLLTERLPDESTILKFRHCTLMRVALWLAKT